MTRRKEGEFGDLEKLGITVEGDPGGTDVRWQDAVAPQEEGTGPDVLSQAEVMTFLLIDAVATAYRAVDARASDRFARKAAGYAAQPDVVFAKILPKFVVHILVRSRYSAFDAVRKSGTSNAEWEWVPDAVQEAARLYNTGADPRRLNDLGNHIEDRWIRTVAKTELPWDVIELQNVFMFVGREPDPSPGELFTGKKELQQLARVQVSAAAAATTTYACGLAAADTMALGLLEDAFQGMIWGASSCAVHSALARSWPTALDAGAIRQAREARRAAFRDYANELLSLLSSASVKGARAGHVSERDQRYLNPRKRVRNDTASAGAWGRKVWAKMRAKKRFSIHDASKATGLSEVSVRVAVDWLKGHGYLRAEGGKYVPSHASFRPNPEPGVADCSEAWESYCEKPGLEIAACREAWDHYCARPNKTRLRVVLKILEGMKDSKSAKVRGERTRCLRAAKPEAKSLGL